MTKTRRTETGALVSVRCTPGRRNVNFVVSLRRAVGVVYGSAADDRWYIGGGRGRRTETIHRAVDPPPRFNFSFGARLRASRLSPRIFFYYFFICFLHRGKNVQGGHDWNSLLFLRISEKLKELGYRARDQVFFHEIPARFDTGRRGNYSYSVGVAFVGIWKWGNGRIMFGGG